MAKRYGRNQRRQHRERIAELEKENRKLELRNSLFCGPADPSWRQLEEFGIAGWEINHGESQRMRDHTARVEIYGQIDQGLIEERYIGWQGRAYYLDRIDVPQFSEREFLGEFICTVTLRGISQ